MRLKRRFNRTDVCFSDTIICKHYTECQNNRVFNKINPRYTESAGACYEPVAPKPSRTKAIHYEGFCPGYTPGHEALDE